MYKDESIAYFRHKQNLTQKEFAKKLNIKRYYYSLIENKKMLPDSELAEKISFELRIPIGQLWVAEELNYISFKNK